VTVDTTKDTLVVHDGSTAGGHPLAKENNATLAGNVTLSGGTANGVAYLNGSKVVTTGSALTFDGTTFKVQNNNAVTPVFQIQSYAAVGTAIANITYDQGTDIYKLSNPSTYAGSGIGFGTGASSTTRYHIDTSGVHIWTVASEGMRLTSTGLGIGTSSPSNKLHVNGNIRVEGATSEIFMAVGAERTISASGSASSTALTFKRWNGVAYLNDVVMDGSGNLGLGVTPSAWNSATKNIQNPAGSVYGINTTDMGVAQNLFLDSTGTWKYVNTAAASYFAQTGGAFSWASVGSGTAGATASLTTKMTLDASGNLGIGVTTLGNKLEVNGGINMAAATATVPSYGMMVASGVGTQITSALHTAFYNNGSERARIDSSGSWLVGTTSTDPIGARVNGFAFYKADNVIRIRGNAAPLNVGINATSGTSIQFFTDNGTAAVGAGNISSNGSSTAYNTSSDYRLKDNQQPLTGSGAFIDALKPKTWNWKADGSSGVGFIAHEVQEVSPGSVVGQKDAVDKNGKPIMQAMEYGSAEFIANIIAELQSLRARVAALES
jgi:hypothetical protein